MNDLLFAVPWWLPTLLSVIGIALFINGNKSQVAKVRNAGVGVILLALVWALVSFLVDTDKEKVEKGTRQVIQAVVAREWGKFESSLTPSASLVLNDRTRISGAPILTAYAKAGVDAVRLTSATVKNLVIEETGPLITAHCDLITLQEQVAPTESSTWQFEWEKTGTEWKLREIRLLDLKGVSLDQVPGVIPRPK